MPVTGQDRVALVTGASAGIGQACADRLAAHGWTVVGASRRGTGSAGGGAEWEGLVMDVDDDGAVAAGVAGVLARHGRIDALVAAAGWGIAGPVETTPLDDVRAQMETNFYGVVRTTQAVLPAMRRQGAGRVVPISSIGGVIAIPFQAFYSATKFALEGWAEALAYEVAPFGVDVTLVQPGNVRTDFTSSRRMAVAPGGDAAYDAATQAAVGRMARDEAEGVGPDAVARVVHKVLEARRPPRRATVGKAVERSGVLAKRLLPHRVFEAAARSSLGVD
jgi:NAD(P)-dependent dehydrogenase (short-subunit alcohol dehydrogenase family)